MKVDFQSVQIIVILFSTCLAILGQVRAQGRDELVSQLRSQVEGLPLDGVMKTNETLIRYLLQSRNDVNTALARIMKTAEWRQANNINLLALDDVSLIKDHLPYECTGTTEDGNPVFYIQLGKWNLKRIQRNRQNARLQSYIVQLMENSLRASAKEINPKTEQPNYQSVFIVDLHGFTLRSLLSGFGRSLATLARTGQLYENHYPKSIKKVHVIRTPPHFRPMWLLTRRFLTSDDADIIEIYSTLSSKWRNELRKNIPKTAVPKNLRI